MEVMRNMTIDTELFELGDIISFTLTTGEKVKAKAMSCRPVGLQKVPGNHIFDEDQSVKWNREQVELNNKKYQSEVARLNTEKNKARDSVYNLIIEKIQYEVGHRLSRKKAEAIWNRAYEDGHSFGFYEIRCRLSDLIDLAITLLGGEG